MKFRECVFVFIFSIIIAGIFTFPLFSTHGQETTFDGPTHMQTIAQFSQGLQDGQFPVRWGAGFARHGMPIPIVAQQLTSYLGAGFHLLVGDVVLAYRLVVFVGAWLSAVLMYVFVRMHTQWLSASLATFLFTFAPYRIVNVYIRGALPEFFASVGVLGALVGLRLALKGSSATHRGVGYVTWMFSVAVIVLTHPFVLIIASPLIAVYGLFLLKSIDMKKMKYALLVLGTGAGLGVLMSAYYSVPLFVEIRYFFYGQSTDHFVAHNFLPMVRFFTERWTFFGPDVATRGNILQGGLIEGGVLIVGLAYVFIARNKLGKSLTAWMAILLVCYMLSMLSLSELVYKHTFMNAIQHPWRMLSGYSIVVPILAGLCVHKLTHSRRVIAVLVLIVAIGCLRFPQLYTKNARIIPQKSYFITSENTHGLIMNTVWMGDARSYPYQKVKGSIIEGSGTILTRQEGGIEHVYEVQASTPIRMLDYTFYFPGWEVLVDGNTFTNIEFQDPSYRGLITFIVPEGSHRVVVRFRETKVRMLGNILSLIGMIGAGVYAWYVLKKKK